MAEAEPCSPGIIDYMAGRSVEDSMAGFNANPSKRILRLLIMLPAASMLITSLVAGLARVGAIFLPDQHLQLMHAPAIIFGFISALIVLERAVAIDTWWALIASPVFSTASILLFFQPTVMLAKTLLVLGFLLLFLIYLKIWQRQPAIATYVQVLAALSGIIAVLAWFQDSAFVRVSAPALMFLVLTIMGERIELGRFAGLRKRGEQVGAVLATFLLLSSVATIYCGELAYRFLGAMLVVVVIWLLTVDVARRTVRAKGATRYMALALLFGYFWLFVAGCSWAIFASTKGMLFDLTVHAVGLGFVMSMIMAHASVILPAVLRVKLPYRKFFYVPLFLLQLSLVLRIIGDLAAQDLLRAIGGIFNVTAIVLFLLSAVASAVIANGPPKKPKVASDGI